MVHEPVRAQKAAFNSGRTAKVPRPAHHMNREFVRETYHHRLTRVKYDAEMDVNYELILVWDGLCYSISGKQQPPLQYCTLFMPVLVQNLSKTGTLRDVKWRASHFRSSVLANTVFVFVYRLCHPEPENQ